MNKLSYGLLSLLLTQPLSGYDLRRKINKFWRCTHSSIYPLLAELEEKGYVEFTEIEQKSKPDKKIYTLTGRGAKAVREWFRAESGETVIRDEAALKLYCLQFMDPEEIENLLKEIEGKYQKKLEEHKKYLEDIALRLEKNSEDALKTSFGSYILTQRAINEALEGIEWCRWVREIYKNKEFNFTEQNFPDWKQNKISEE